jgi:hypothetical protein
MAATTTDRHALAMTDNDATPPKSLVLYLVSHASGELVEMLARNSVAQLEDVSLERQLWKMVRHLGQIPEILATIATRRGAVFHSLSDEELRSALEQGCHHLAVPCMFALEPFVSHLARYCGAEVRFKPSVRDAIDEDYYTRVEAMKYTLAHDDGLAADDLEGADVVLVGVSRATKTPTCMYLASRGVKAANVPLVPGVPLPDGVMQAKAPLVVGLVIDPLRLALVRDQRLRALSQDQPSDYSDLDSVRDELRDAKRLFARRGWRMIDVSHRSIEQTASMIIDMLKQRRAAAEPGGSG